jgi:methylglyoxal synthase
MLDAEDWRARRWRVALVAHDAKRTALAAFVHRYQTQFRNWELLATASTGEALREARGLRLRTLLPVGQGGEVRMAAEIAAGEIDALIFLRDPLAAAQATEPDVAALLRVADLHNVALATNLATAECLVRALSPERALANRG